MQRIIGEKHSHLPLILFFAYLLFFLILAINPYDRKVWFAENLPILIIVAVLVALYIRGIRFSNLAYILMSFLIFIHTLGGHYTFARVPFDAITQLFGFERNNYDRIGHFTAGFFAFAVAELIYGHRLVRNKVMVFLFSLFAIMSVAAAYEIFEWQFAMMADPTAGAAVLGSQGDEWDAQKDMLLDTLGALFSLGLFFLVERARRREEISVPV